MSSQTTETTTASVGIKGKRRAHFTQFIWLWYCWKCCKSKYGYDRGSKIAISMGGPNITEHFWNISSGGPNLSWQAMLVYNLPRAKWLLSCMVARRLLQMMNPSICTLENCLWSVTKNLILFESCWLKNGYNRNEVCGVRHQNSAGTVDQPLTNEAGLHTMVLQTKDRLENCTW